MENNDRDLRKEHNRRIMKWTGNARLRKETKWNAHQTLTFAEKKTECGLGNTPNHKSAGTTRGL